MRTKTIETNTKASFSLVKKDITELKSAVQQFRAELAKAAGIQNRLSESMNKLEKRKR